MEKNMEKFTKEEEFRLRALEFVFGLKPALTVSNIIAEASKIEDYLKKGK